MKFRNMLLMAAAVLSCTASITAATIEHTFVSGNGSDSNPCTFTLPCHTFTGALANTTAGGLITAIDMGDFGSVVIKQSVTIDGANQGSISFSGNSSSGIVIMSGANVTIQNLSINGMGSGANGIFVPSGGIVTVDNCHILNIAGDGIYFLGAGNLTVENSRIESFIGNNLWAVEINANAAENVVVRNTVINASPFSNSNVGFLIDSGTGPVMASLQNVTISGAGGYAVLSNTGVTEITDSVITQSGYGVYAQSGGTISVASSLITSNSTGVCSYSSSKIRLDNNDIYDNPTAISNCGGIVKTSTSNKTSGTISIPAADVSDSVTF